MFEQKQMTKKEWLVKAVEKYGMNAKQWKFKCPSCNIVTSREENKHAHTVCTNKEGHSGDWHANGLFNGPILIIIDPTKPHNSALKENCSYVFAFGD